MLLISDSSLQHTAWWLIVTMIITARCGIVGGKLLVGMPEKMISSSEEHAPDTPSKRSRPDESIKSSKTKGYVYNIERALHHHLQHLASWFFFSVIAHFCERFEGVSEQHT